MSALDYIVLAAYVISVILVGLLASRQTPTTLEGYFLGGRVIPWMAGTASLIATGISCKSLIGLPGLSYAGDLTYFQMYLISPLAALIGTVLFLPHFSRLRVVSAYEYLGWRFGSKTRSFASVLFQIETALVLGTVIGAPSLVLAQATGLSYELSVLILVSGTVLYTSVGGMRAVIWTDVVQLFMFVGIPFVVLFHVISTSSGNFSALLQTAAAHDKLRVFDFSFDGAAEVTFWSVIASILFWHISNYGVNQTFIQRYLTAPSLYDSRRIILVSAVGLLVIWGSLLGMGVILFAYNVQHPGTVPPGTVPDRVFTVFIMATLPEGLKGAFVAAAFAAGMSTLSSMLNSLGTISIVDVWKLHLPDNADEATWIRRARLLTLFWGGFSLVSALFVLRFGTVITAGIKLGSVISGALLGMFLLGLFSTRATAVGVVLGCVVSLATTMCVMATSTLSWAWYCGLGTMTAVTFGYAASAFFSTPRGTQEFGDP